MTKEELENATGKELIEQRNYCGIDGYYSYYLDDVNAEMLKRFNRLTEITDDKNKLLDVISNYEVKVADLEQKNADLKEEIDNIAFARGELERENKSLENIKNIYIGDLLEAKEIIKDYMIVATSDHTTVCSVPEENRCINVLKLNEQVKQFIKDSDV